MEPRGWRRGIHLLWWRMEPFRLITDLAPWHKMIEKALKHDVDGHTWLELQERVRCGEFIAVEKPDAAVLIVERLELPRGIALNIVLCAGYAYATWLTSAIGFLKALAQDQGCEWIRLQGRGGWSRALKGSGFKERARLLSMEIRTHD